MRTEVTRGKQALCVKLACGCAPCHQSPGYGEQNKSGRRALARPNQSGNYLRDLTFTLAASLPLDTPRGGERQGARFQRLQLSISRNKGREEHFFHASEWTALTFNLYKYSPLQAFYYSNPHSLSWYNAWAVQRRGQSDLLPSMTDNKHNCSMVQMMVG